MSLTPSTMMPLGTIAPAFKLPDTASGRDLSLDDLKSDIATVIMFICNHCPYVKHVQHGLASLSIDYSSKGISFIAINSNDIDNYPEDAPDKMGELVCDLGNPFPYLFDETQDVARSYNAACTPDFFVFDKDLRCVYRGQLDDSRPGNDIPVTGCDIRKTLDVMIEGNEITTDQKPSVGCNIKWK